MMGPRAIEENRKTMSAELLAEKRTLGGLQAKAEYQMETGHGDLDLMAVNAKLREFNARWIVAGGHSGSCFVEV